MMLWFFELWLSGALASSCSPLVEVDGMSAEAGRVSATLESCGKAGDKEAWRIAFRSPPRELLLSQPEAAEYRAGLVEILSKLAKGKPSEDGCPHLISIQSEKQHIEACENGPRFTQVRRLLDLLRSLSRKAKG